MEYKRSPARTPSRSIRQSGPKGPREVLGLGIPGAKRATCTRPVAVAGVCQRVCAKCSDVFALWRRPHSVCWTGTEDPWKSSGVYSGPLQAVTSGGYEEGAAAAEPSA